MKNGEQPINPIVMENTLPGLTKREYFAGLAMQGMLAGGNYSETETPYCAVKLADELLKQLQND